jgi:hypothetical protein
LAECLEPRLCWRHPGRYRGYEPIDQAAAVPGERRFLSRSNSFVPNNIPPMARKPGRPRPIGGAGTGASPGPLAMLPSISATVPAWEAVALVSTTKMFDVAPTANPRFSKGVGASGPWI